MAEPTQVPPPMTPAAPVTTPSTPAAPAAPAAPTMESALAEFDGLIASPKPTDAKPDAVPAKPADKKPDEPKPVAKPAEPKKPDVPIKGEAMLRKRLAEVERERDEAKTSAQTELGKLNGKLKELEGKRYWTKEDEEKHAAMEKRQQQLESDLYSRDYKESPDFKDKYQKRADKVFNTVTKTLKGMTVKYEDAGEEKERQATIADFNRIRSLDDSLVEQRKLAKSMFGEDADIILSHARELSNIEEEANDAIETQKKNWTQTKEQFLQSQQQNQKLAQTTYNEITSQLVSKYPDYFGEDAANPEANAALKSGLEYVEGVSKLINTLPPQEAAKITAIVRMMAGSFPKHLIIIKQLKTQLSEAKESLGKLRKSDPGSGGETTPSEPIEPKTPVGIEGMAAEFNKIVI
jgi:hypothetical protein